MVHIYGGPLVPREKTFSQIIIVILFKTPYISLYVFLIRFVTARIKIKTSIDWPNLFMFVLFRNPKNVNNNKKHFINYKLNILRIVIIYNFV